MIESDEGTKIRVRYDTPKKAVAPPTPEMQETLELPLEPDFKGAEKVDVNLHQSMVSAFKMGNPYDKWFTACFGFDTVLLYIGDGRRPVLGTFSPKSQQQASQTQKGWLSSITSYISGSDNANGEPDWLTFTDCAPLLVATEASLANVNKRLDKPISMIKFRPNIVVDGEKEWDEDFWAELAIDGKSTTLALTKLCNRCTSLNVDYATGQPAEGDEGMVLKKLMVDRRVDLGLKYSPSFGRYGFLGDSKDGDEEVSLELGDEVSVTKTFEERPKWDWPMKDRQAARFYGQS